jgi:TPR repeat protein
MEKSLVLYEKAEKYLYGLDGAEVDYTKAYDCFIEAINLGNIDAYLQIGLMYRKGEGVEKNKKLEYLFLMEGLDKGDTTCYAELAFSYYIEDNYIEANSYWSSYFSLTPTHLIKVQYVYRYIEFVIISDIKLRFIDKLSILKVDLIELVDELDVHDDIIDKYSMSDFINENIPNHNYEYDEAYNIEMAYVYRYGVKEEEIDFKKSMEYFERYFYLIETPNYEQLLLKYYQNEEEDELFDKWINEGIAFKDYNCFASKAIMFSERDYIAVAQLYWAKYFSLSRKSIEPLFALEYIVLVQKHGVKLKYKEIIEPLIEDMKTLNKELLQNLHKLESTELIYRVLDFCNISERGIINYFG